MERLRSMKIIVWLVAALLVLELVMLAVMVRPCSFYVWASIGVVALLCIYLVRLSLVLIKELKEKEDKK